MGSFNVVIILAIGDLLELASAFWWLLLQETVDGVHLQGLVHLAYS